MGDRFGSEARFREAVAALGLPANDPDLVALWEMVRDLHEQADDVRRFLEESAGPRRR